MLAGQISLAEAIGQWRYPTLKKANTELYHGPWGWDSYVRAYGSHGKTLMLLHTGFYPIQLAGQALHGTDFAPTWYVG